MTAQWTFYWQFPNLRLPFPAELYLKEEAEKGLQTKHGGCTFQHLIVSLTALLSASGKT